MINQLSYYKIVKFLKGFLGDNYFYLSFEICWWSSCCLHLLILIQSIFKICYLKNSVYRIKHLYKTLQNSKVFWRAGPFESDAHGYGVESQADATNQETNVCMRYIYSKHWYTGKSYILSYKMINEQMLYIVYTTPRQKCERCRKMPCEAAQQS